MKLAHAHAHAHAREAATLLGHHRRAGTVLDQLPQSLRPLTAADGHAIQSALPAVAGQSLVGWKIAATSQAGQTHINVSGPLAGRILADGVVAADSTLSLKGNRMRVVEPEFAFFMGRAGTARVCAVHAD